MKRILLILLALTTIITVNSCKKREDRKHKSDHPELNGSYTYYYYNSWNNGLYEESDYRSYDFDKTNVCWYYSLKWSYTPNIGWINATKESYSFDLLWKIENNNFYTKLYQNKYAEWYNEGSYEYISPHFKLDDMLFEKD